MSRMHYLVDTDWVISYQHSVPRVVGRLNALLAQGVGLSIVSLAELYEGEYTPLTLNSKRLRCRSFSAPCKWCIWMMTSAAYSRGRGDACEPKATLSATWTSLLAALHCDMDLRC